MDDGVKKIKDFWEGKAREYGISHESSWGDHYCMQLEVNTLDTLLSEDDRILDIGCGNGLGTLELASRKRIVIKGIDYSAEMVRSAHALLSERNTILKGDVSFDVGDVLQLAERENSFTKAITRRVIINLGTLDSQIKALREVHKVLVPSGVFLMSEATVDGLRRINALRRECGLEELQQPWHNLYIEKDVFIDAVSDFFEIVDVMDFSSTYYVGTRVVQALVKKMMNQSPDYRSEINRFFMQLPPYGDYGIQKLFIFRKK